MKLSKGKIQKLHNTKNQSQRKNKKKGKKRPANHNTLRKRYTNLATKTLKRKNKSTLYGGKENKLGEKFEELIDAMSEVLASKVASKIGSTGKEFQDPIESNKKAAEKTANAADTLLNEVADSITPKTPTDIPDTSVTPTNIPDTSVTPTDIPDTSVTPTNIPDTSVTPTDIPDTSVTPTVGTPAPEATPPKKSTLSRVSNSTRKMRKSAEKLWDDGREKRDARVKAFADKLVYAKQLANQVASQTREAVNKRVQSIDEKKANKIFDDNDEDKSGKIDESEYGKIQEQFVEDGGFLTLPDYSEETYPHGIDKKQFVQLYKTAITEAKANKIFDDNDKDKSGKIDETEYKNIKDKLVKEKGLTLPDYDKIPEGEKDQDGVTQEQFVKLYKDVVNSGILSRISSKGSNTTRKIRNSTSQAASQAARRARESVNKNVLGQTPIEELTGETAARKIFKAETYTAKTDKINNKIYDNIKDYLGKEGLELPNYERITEKDQDGINENQFVNLYKDAKATAITAAASTTETINPIHNKEDNSEESKPIAINPFDELMQEKNNNNTQPNQVRKIVKKINDKVNKQQLESQASSKSTVKKDSAFLRKLVENDKKNKKGK
jgi:Ca2+-binding EF-hand superfamily protein